MDGVPHICSPKIDNNIHNLEILIVIYTLLSASIPRHSDLPIHATKEKTNNDTIIWIS